MEENLERVYTTKRYVHSFETPDSLRFEPVDEIYGREGLYETYDPEFIIDNPCATWYNGSAIKISVMEEQIAEIKAKGGTHLDIDYHGDHDSYIINGVDIHKSTEEEIAKHLGQTEEEKRKEFLERYHRLKKEMGDIEDYLDS